MADRGIAVADGEGPGRRSGALSVLATRNFGSYFVGNLVSALGTWIQNIAQAILIFRLTGSTLAVAVVNFGQFAAVLFLTPWTGSAADRFDRKTIMIVSQLFSATAAAVLAIAVAIDQVEPWLIVLVAVSIGLGYAITVPSLQAIIPDLVDAEDLPQAISLNAATFNLARAIGPVLGAAAVVAIGFGWAFALNAMTFFVFAAALLLTKPQPSSRPVDGQSMRFREGVRLLIEQRELGLLILAVAAVSITSDPINTLTPGFAVEILDKPDTFTGVLVGVFGVGAVLAAFVPRIRPSVGPAAALNGVGMIVFAMAPGPAIALAGLGLSGFGFLSSVTGATTRLQLEVDASVRGRVMAVWSLAFLGTRPIASLIDGFLAEAAGLRVAAAAMALPALAVPLFLRRSPS